MNSGRIFFDPASCGHGNTLFLGNCDSLSRGARSVMNMEETSKRRPFFSSPDELFDEEYYDEQLPEKKRRLSSEQVRMLEESFEAENKLEPERKTQLAKSLGLQPRQVAVWYQNRRARWKTKQLERDFNLLKSSYDKLESDYKTILKDNENLKSEVVSLTEKFEAKVMDGAPIFLQKSELLPVDRLSSGSVESAVVDENGLHLVDSCDNDFGAPCMGPVDGVQSEEDDGGDDCQSYFTSVFTAAEPDQQEGEPLGCWVWS